MERLNFKPLPTDDGGSRYTNQTLRDPGDDRVHFTNGRRRFVAILVDAGIPLFALWRLSEHDFLVYLVLTAVVLNSIVLQGKTGYSVGKWLLGLRLAYIPQSIRLETKVSFVVPGTARCFARFVLHILDWPLCLGFLRCIWNTYGMSFADSFVHTAVVWDKRVKFIPLDEWRRGQRHG